MIKSVITNKKCMLCVHLCVQEVWRKFYITKPDTHFTFKTTLLPNLISLIRQVIYSLISDDSIHEIVSVEFRAKKLIF